MNAIETHMPFFDYSYQNAQQKYAFHGKFYRHRIKKKEGEQNGAHNRLNKGILHRM